MQHRLRQAYCALREHSSVSYAKIATIGGFCDLDFIVIKATNPDDVPLAERHVQELVKIFTFSPSASKAFSPCFTRRFGKTQCWRVALKCLFLLHRLLRSLPESTSFRSDLLWSRSNGFLCLNPCSFRDTSSSPSNSHDFTYFIRSYARLLDQAIDCIMVESSMYIDRKTAAEMPESLSEKMQEIGRILDVLPQLQNLIDRVVDCHPLGAASRSFVIRSAMKQIIRDSFLCYAAFRRDIIVLLDNLFQMQYRFSISALRIYKKAASQASRLNEFYESCKEMGLCGAYEYPVVDKIPDIHVRALESFISEMWQLTESSSSTSMISSSESESQPSETESGPSSSTEDGCEKQLVRLQTVISTQWEKFEGEEEEPLIQMDVNELSWEALLESSAGYPGVPHNIVHFHPSGYGYKYGYGWAQADYMQENSRDAWKLQVYNPFCHGYNTSIPQITYYGVSTGNGIPIHGDYS